MATKNNYFKIVLLGEGRVGKTSMVLRYIRDTFCESQESTIQATYLEKDIKMADRKVTLSVWDTAGQERFHALGPIYYRNADGALLVYDITDHDTFDKVKDWVKELRGIVGNDIVLCIAGNKCDLRNHQVKQSEYQQYAKSVGAEHFMTSAKANKGVEEAFLSLTKRMLKKKGSSGDSVSLKKPRQSLRITDDGSSVNRIDSRKMGVSNAAASSESSSGYKCC
eukprot:gb/GECH01013658.1/.p1 GENE.gb/GECH01013658.1/~~gb/GECH01013658.1/.p1  ORF type:complete len:223 (+),score=51.94 gb/GECH01013658.1/:1-669(+)